MELYKVIEGYENYHIYRDGRVWSTIGKGKFKKLCEDIGGYVCIGFHKNGKKETLKVHRVVANAFIPNPDNKAQVDHIDRCRTNNHVSNLRWVTNLENHQNKGNFKSNISGHKNISYDKFNDRWIFTKMNHGVKTQKYFKTKMEAICYKFILILKIKSHMI